MTLPDGVRRAFRLAARNGSIDREVSDEIRFHLDAREAELEAAGLAPSAAMEQAQREYGDIDASHAELARIDGGVQRRAAATEWLGAFAHDMRYALRGLRRAPGFTAVMLATLALGIGANTAVFSVVNALLLNPIAYRDASRIAFIWRSMPGQTFSFTPSQPSIDEWRRNARGFDGIEAYDAGDHTLTGHGDPQILHTASISATFAQFTGRRLIRGRGFLPEETQAGAAPVAVISEHLWRRAFDADENVLNNIAVLDGKSYTIVGVSPEQWRLPTLFSYTPTDVWLPLTADPARRGGNVIGRLKRDVSANEAAKELDTLDARLAVNGAKIDLSSHVKIVALAESVGFRQTLLIVGGAVIVLLLISCVNVAHLLLARGAAREREYAIRQALGATRTRLIRQLLAECALVAIGGCVLGLIVGFAGLRALIALRPASLDTIALASMDNEVLAFTILVSLATGVAFGIMGAFRSASTATAESLKGTSTTGTATGEGRRLRSMLVMTETALSAMLLVAAVLLVRTVVNLQRVDPGFDVTGLYAMKFDLPKERYQTAVQRATFAQRLLDRARVIPGISAATVAAGVPPMPTGIIFGELETEGVSSANARAGIVYANHVRPEYFVTTGMRILAGRTFDDGSTARNEVIVNAGLARALWPSMDATGKRFRFKPETGDTANSWYSVAAVAPDAAITGLLTDRDVRMLYLPSRTGTEWSGPTLVFRVSPGAHPLASVRRAALEMDSGLAPPKLVNVSDAMRASIASQRFTMLLVTVFAGLAAVLSAIGLYGMISWMVTQRTREIGIRIALGGSRAHIARVVVGEGTVMCVAGLAVGLGAAVWATALVKSQLYGVNTSDPFSYVATAILLMGVSALACIVPLRRAAGVDPLIAMRAD